MFFAIFVIGVIVTTALNTWFMFNYYGGVYKVLTAFRDQTGIIRFSALKLFLLITGFWAFISLLAWPLLLILNVIVLVKRFNETGSFGIVEPKEIPAED